MAYFICPECGADHVEVIHDVRMIEEYLGDDIKNSEEDLTYERDYDAGFVSIECLECGYSTEDPFEFSDKWIPA